MQFPNQVVTTTPTPIPGFPQQPMTQTAPMQAWPRPDAISNEPVVQQNPFSLKNPLIRVALAAAACYGAYRLYQDWKASKVVEQNPLAGYKDQYAERAREDLAAYLGVRSTLIQVRSVEEVIWPDTSLGVPGAAEHVLQKATPGFAIVMQYGYVEYIYGTDMDGNMRRKELHRQKL